MATHIVAVLAMHGVVPYDLSIPCEVFGRLRGFAPGAGYQVRVCGEASELRTRSFNIRAPWSLEHLADADTVIIPGTDEPALNVPSPVLDAVRGAAENGARIASICTGAFILAATGLLNGQRATTHWLAASLLAERYPEITVDPNVLFVDNERTITSAGASAGLDMCLHLIRKDFGQAAAADAARLAVAPLDRRGGQAQFIQHPTPTSSTSLAVLLEWMQRRIGQSLTIEQLASQAATSPRTLNRRFREQVGTTPLQWLLDARVRKAQELLEVTPLTVEEIARSVGFESPSSFRDRFRRGLGVSPAEYRRTFAGSIEQGRA